MSLEFTRHDFENIYDGAIGIGISHLVAKRAQEMFNIWLSHQPTVYGQRLVGGDFTLKEITMNGYGTNKSEKCTHRAKLICIEPLEKCDHEAGPITITPGVGQKTLIVTHSQEWSCVKCGVKLKAAWREA